MQKLCNYFIKFLILIFTILNLNPTLANTQKVKDRKFEGYQTKFEYEKYPEERELAYQYYLNERSQYLPGIEKKNIGIDLYDIDGDGIKEIFVYVNGGDRCPRAGCPFVVLRTPNNEKGVYIKVPWSSRGTSSSAIYESDAPKILDSMTLGYHDILFGQEGDRVVIKRWNGKYYDIGEVIDY